MRVDRDSVCPAKVLPQRLLQISGEHLAHRLDQQPVIGIVLELPREDNGDLAPRVDAADDLFLDDAWRRANAAIDHFLRTMEGWETREVALDEGLHGGHVEAAHEDEGKVARVGKAALVEGHRPV